MTDPNDYDSQVEAIRAYNQPVLKAFQTWLEESGMARKTIKNHVDNFRYSANRPAWSRQNHRYQENRVPVR
jgi:hypothetical protein